EMTRSISEVAVCCSKASVRSVVRWLRSSVRWRSSLSNRAFSIAITACAAKFCTTFDLLIGERPHLLAVDDDKSDHLVVSEQRHANQAPGMREFDRRYAHFVPVRRFGGDIGYLIGLLRDNKSSGAQSRVDLKYRLAAQKLRPFRWSAMGCSDAKEISLAQPQIAKFSPADSDGVLQYGFKHEMEVAWRA